MREMYNIINENNHHEGYIRTDERLTLEMLASLSLHDGKLTILL